MENDLERIPRSYEDAIDLLARRHAEGGNEDLEILSFPNPEERVVRLVEISDEFPHTGQVYPIVMGRSSDFPFRSSVILLSRKEWEEVEKGAMSFPGDWNKEGAVKIWPN